MASRRPGFRYNCRAHRRPFGRLTCQRFQRDLLGLNTDCEHDDNLQKKQNTDVSNDRRYARKAIEQYWENLLEISRRTGCLLINGSKVRTLVRPPSFPGS